MVTALADLAARNLDALAHNAYPGRGLVMGRTPDGRSLAQVYWIMGRSENSRNRVFVQAGEDVHTAPFDPAKLVDASLVIYRAVAAAGPWHVVSNGDQTDSIVAGLARGEGFEEALRGWTFEPDAPNYTPRISGLMPLEDARGAYCISILKAQGNDPQHGVRSLFAYERAWPGFGHCITTYAGDGAPLPPFEGEPLPVPILDDLDALADLYWRTLHASTKVALVAKLVDAAAGSTRIRIINAHGGGQAAPRP